MDKELVAHFVDHVKLAGGAECAASSAAGMLRLELRVHEGLIQLGREAVQNLAAEVGSGYQGTGVKRGKSCFGSRGSARRRCTGCMDRSP